MLTVDERVYTLSYLWKEAEYNFAFWAELPELDWDAEYKKYLPLVINARSDLEYAIRNNSYTRAADRGVHGKICISLLLARAAREPFRLL